MKVDKLILKQEILLHRIANRVRQSLELKEILNAMVGEMRAYLGTDRVKIYQFNTDGSGVVIAESLASDKLPSLMGLHFPADDIPLYARELFVQARQRSVVDLTTHEIGISPLNSLQGEEDQDIRYRPIDPCHVEYLKAMGVKSSVVVPIVLESQQTGKYQPPSLIGQAQLWGLLVSHHSEARKVTEEELQLIQAVVDQVCIAISHSYLLNQVREQAHQEANINNLTKILYTSPTVKLQPAVEEAVKTFNGSGGRLYLLASDNQSVEIYTCGIQPESIDTEESRVVEENRLWQKYLYSVIETFADQTGYKPWSVEWMRSMYHITSSDTEQVNSVNSKLWAIDDLYREPLFRTLAPFFESSRIRSLLIIPLQYGDSILGCLTIFRSEVDTEITWAGYHNPDTRQLMPRQSFEVWRQIKTNQAQVWTLSEIRYASALSERFATAVVQYRLYQQVQALNTNLELQVQERTNNLRQAQTQLIQSEKMSSLGQLVAGIAHEINNPINFIYGNVTHINNYTQTVLNLLKKYQINCPQLTKTLEEEIEQADIEYIIEDLPLLCQSLKAGAERISQLVTSLRTFSRFDQAEIKKVDIHEGIESALSLLQHRLEPSGTGKNIEIIRNYAVLPLVECFAGQLNQVFMNLLLNAIDELQECSQNSKQIVITTSIIKNNLIQISFADNGRGIKTCYQHKIFDPFFTTKPVGSGIGLGLSISYQIIEQHGGKLSCISQPNQGSNFVIKIPMQLLKSDLKLS